MCVRRIIGALALLCLGLAGCHTAGKPLSPAIPVRSAEDSGGVMPGK